MQENGSENVASFPYSIFQVDVSLKLIGEKKVKVAYQNLSQKASGFARIFDIPQSIDCIPTIRTVKAITN